MPQPLPPGPDASREELQRYADFMREKSERLSLESLIRQIVRDELALQAKRHL